jgi:glycosyltransferase involved in cell wall biosynthesis
MGPAWSDSNNEPPARSVPVTALVLMKDEAVNIARCIASLGWCQQVLCIDSGSTDGTVGIARASGAEVVETSWRGFGAQREWALRHDLVRNEWVYFVDADEWVSAALASEIDLVVAAPEHAVYVQRLRLIFLGRWISRAGWYGNSWVARLALKSDASCGTAEFGERVFPMTGSIGKLSNDIVDEDLKGLGSWIAKHAGYVQLAASQRLDARHAERAATMPLTRWIMKQKLFPLVPCKPLALWVYMYILRGGFMLGREGFVFCAMHGIFEFQTGQLVREATRKRHHGA